MGAQPRPRLQHHGPPLLQHYPPPQLQVVAAKKKSTCQSLLPAAPVCSKKSGEGWGGRERKSVNLNKRIERPDRQIYADADANADADVGADADADEDAKTMETDGK